jgi:hypothetical protein
VNSFNNFASDRQIGLDRNLDRILILVMIVRAAQSGVRSFSYSPYDPVIRSFRVISPLRVCKYGAGASIENIERELKAVKLRPRPTLSGTPESA